MTTNSIKPTRARARRWVYALAAWALLVCLGQSPDAFAQGQWTTDGANIHNTNTGNVGVGTASSEAKLHVVGDLLGVAMKTRPVELGGGAIHRPGTIIGKALEPLEKGTGEILIPLSLQ
jgi:hypothetical protein